MAQKLVCDVCDHAIMNPSFVLRTSVRRDVQAPEQRGTYLDVCMSCTTELPTNWKRLLHALLPEDVNLGGKSA